MRIITSNSWYLLLLLSLLLAPSPSFQRDLAHKEKLLPLSLPSIKSTELISSVSKRGGHGGHGGGGSHGGGSHGGSGHSGSGHGGSGRGRSGGKIPFLAAGAAGGGSHGRHNGAVRNHGKPNSMENLGIALLVTLLATRFKHFALKDDGKQRGSVMKGFRGAMVRQSFRIVNLLM